MLIKSRKPGPRAKFLDLPTISYGSEYKPVGFPAFKSVCVYSFGRSDVEMLAKLVHGDVEKHIRQKTVESNVRAAKARRKRVREHMIQHFQEKVEISTGAVAKYHARGNVDKPLPKEKKYRANRKQGWRSCWLPTRRMTRMTTFLSTLGVGVAATFAATNTACAKNAATCQDTAMSGAIRVTGSTRIVG